MTNNEFQLINTWLKKVEYIFAQEYSLDEIQKEELISINELVKIIHDFYQKFKEEYNHLEKMDIGNNNNIISYIDNEGFRILIMQINEQDDKTIVPEDFYQMTITDDNNRLELSFENSETFIIKDNINPIILKNYLDLFSKYYPIFSLYRDLNQQNLIVSNRNNYLMMRMNATEDSLINGLEGIEFIIQNFNELGNNYVINLKIDLKDDIKINNKNSKIYINDQEIKKGPLYKKILDEVFNNIKFKRSKLNNIELLECQETGKNKCNRAYVKKKQEKK